MTSGTPTWELFEQLVQRILESNSYLVQRHSRRGDAGFDLIGQLTDDQWAIEVKYYRTARAQPTLIESAAKRLLANGVAAGTTKAMLIVSCFLPPAMREALEEKFSVTFVDRMDLGIWAAKVPIFAQELDALLESDPSTTRDVSEQRANPVSKSRPLPAAPLPAKETRGANLCEELKRIKRGRKEWSNYEDICARILQYLFTNDLQGWHKQKRTDDGLNRFDFVCRVRPTTDFWKFLIDHLNSRYILFEFKNYTGKIKQGQILTTEKYLLDRGLRRTAIILTRAGAEPDALRMTQGSMREHGKLMLILNDEKLCEMLHVKDWGDDPTDCLFDVADEFLLTLPR